MPNEPIDPTTLLPLAMLYAELPLHQRINARADEQAKRVWDAAMIKFGKGLSEIYTASIFDRNPIFDALGEGRLSA